MFNKENILIQINNLPLTNTLFMKCECQEIDCVKFNGCMKTDCPRKSLHHTIPIVFRTTNSGLATTLPHEYTHRTVLQACILTRNSAKQAGPLTKRVTLIYTHIHIYTHSRQKMVVKALDCEKLPSNQFTPIILNKVSILKCIALSDEREQCCVFRSD